MSVKIPSECLFDNGSDSSSSLLPPLQIYELLLGYRLAQEMCEQVSVGSLNALGDPNIYILILLFKKKIIVSIFSLTFQRILLEIEIRADNPHKLCILEIMYSDALALEIFFSDNIQHVRVSTNN